MNIKQKGFTLIELLVVVAIISLLSSVVLASVKESRDKAQISAFVSQLKQVQNALELYRSDVGSYPPGPVNTTRLDNTITNHLTGYLSPLTYPSFIADPSRVYYFSSPLSSDYRCNTANTTDNYIIIIPEDFFSQTELPFSTTKLANGTILASYCLSFE